LSARSFSDRTYEFEFSHQPPRTVTTTGDALPPQLLPDLLDSVDVEVVLVDSADLSLQLFVAQPAS